MRLATQLSVFLENKPGTLASMCDQLAASDINILALSVGDTADYAVVRLVVDKPEEAVHLLGEAGTIVVENEVLLVELDNRIGALGSMAHKLSDADVNIDYAYCAVGADQPQGVLVLRTADPEKAMGVLS
jgi:hypothetical protein